MKRLASEYQNTIARATGDSQPVTRPSITAQPTNSTDDTTTNRVASAIDIAPRGISRIDVRGFIASQRASASRLNPIAADRAVIIAPMIHATRVQVSGDSRAASSAPTSANGKANTEWLTRTNDAHVDSRLATLVITPTPGDLA